MKKRSLIALAATLTVAMLSACGTSESLDNSQQKKETDVSSAETKTESAKSSGGSSSSELIFSWWGNQTRNERTQKVLDLYTDQNPNITFDGQFSEWADYWNKLATAAAGNSLPDIVQMDYKYLDQYVQSGLLMDLSPYIESGEIDISDCNMDVINSAKIGDGIYALCIGINAPSLVYNKTLVEQAGITIKDNMNLEEFLDISRKIYEKTGYKTNIAYGDGEQFIEYYLRGKDITMFDDGKIGGEISNYVDYFKLYEEGIEEGWMLDPSVFVERTKTTELNPLVYGSGPDNMSWCAFFYSNQYSALAAAAAKGNELGITTWPSENVEKSNYLKPGQFLAISKNTKNPDESARFLDFFNNSVECNNILLGERGVPVSTKISEEIALQLPEKEQEMIKYINEIVSPNSSLINPPAGESASEVVDLLNKLEEKVCYGTMTAEEAGEQFFQRGNELIAPK